MTHEEFMTRMMRPSYVQRMAGPLLNRDGRMGRSARTRYRNAQEQIDQIVVERARTINEGETE